MRSEERHRLATNELAKDLEIGYQKLRPHMTTVLVGLGALLILFGLFSYWRNSQAEQAREAWTEFETALLASDEDLSEVQKVITSEELGGQEAQEWAAMAWADRQLRVAADQFLVLRDASLSRLESVAGLYTQFSTAASSAEIRNRARLGLARVHELRGEIDDAKEQYARVQGALAPIAEGRLEALEAPGAVDAATWLAEAEAILPSVPAGGGTPGVRPPFSADQPGADDDAAEFDPNQTLEEILGGLEGPSDSDRYDTPPSGAEETDDDDDAPAEEGGMEEEPGADADAADADAPSDGDAAVDEESADGADDPADQ